MPRAVDAVIEFLKAEQARGVSHVLLDEDARQGLRDLYRATAKGGKSPPAPAVPQAAPPPTVETPPVVLSVPGGGDKAARLAALREQAEHWQPARALGTLRGTMVFAAGNPDAKIMLVGEAPGYEEERQREPFVGSAGQKLTRILQTMGLSRDEVYLSNIVKFRPATPRQATNNRPPNPQEIAACLPFIHAEVAIVRPACIVALGATAAEGLLGLTAPVASLRGTWYEHNGIPVRLTHHPSYLLRSELDLTPKRQLWEDMLAVMERLEMPITEKQRGFFLPKSQ